MYIAKFHMVPVAKIKKYNIKNFITKNVYLRRNLKNTLIKKEAIIIMQPQITSRIYIGSRISFY